MKKQRKIVIAVSGLIIAVIIVFIIQNIVNTPKGGVCIEEGRIVNGSAPFTSLEVKDAMSELKSIFERPSVVPAKISILLNLISSPCDKLSVNYLQPGG